jgi:hypothetical protein
MFSTAKKSVELVKPNFNTGMRLDRFSELPVVDGFAAHPCNLINFSPEPENLQHRALQTRPGSTA